MWFIFPYPSILPVYLESMKDMGYSSVIDSKYFWLKSVNCALNKLPLHLDLKKAVLLFF